MLHLLKGKRELIYNTLKEQIALNGYPPSVRELCDLVGLKSTSTVHSHLKKLEQLGLIVRDPTKPRAIAIVKDNDKDGSVESVTTLTYKEPYLHYFPNVKESKLKEVLESLIFFKTDNAMYQNKGNTLSSLGIDNNDHVVIDLSERRAHGKIVLAVVHNEFATVKRAFVHERAIKLALDENSADYILVNYKDVDIIGTVVGVLKDI